MPITVMPSGLALTLVVAAYLVGSLSPGWVLARRAGVDLRRSGSGVTGATNAARVLGKSGYAWVLILDTLKGWTMVAAAAWLAPRDPWAALVAPAVVAGHIWPVWLGFRGGRGAATLMGAFLALDWRIVAWAWIPGIIAGVIIRKGFAARAVAFLASGILGWHYLGHDPSDPFFGSAGQYALLASWALVLLAHRSYFGKHVPG